MHVRSFVCAVSAVALSSMVGTAAMAHADTAGPCDAKLLAYFKAEDTAQSAQAGLAAAQQALNGANDSEKTLQDADTAIREAVIALPWGKGSTPVQQRLGQAVRSYKSLYIKAVYSGPDASVGAPSVAAQNLADAAQELVDEADLRSDQGTIFIMKRVAQGVSDMKAAYPLFLTIPDRKADLAQATKQADHVQSSVSIARTGLESCLRSATGQS